MYNGNVDNVKKKERKSTYKLFFKKSKHGLHITISLHRVVNKLTVNESTNQLTN